jgi:hypothetical protein
MRSGDAAAAAGIRWQLPGRVGSLSRYRFKAGVANKPGSPPARPTLLEQDMSNGFSSADMSTAAANGHAEGYQAGYADAVKAMDHIGDANKMVSSAQEALVIHQFRHHDSSDWYDVTPEDQPHVFNDTDFVVRTVYAAPVAAAPVEPNGKLVGWWNGITPGYDGQGIPSIRWGADAENSGHDIPLYDGYNPIHYQQPTPAAPGIDSEVRRLVSETEHYAQPMPGEPQCLVVSMAVVRAVIRVAVEAGARIDAIPEHDDAREALAIAYRHLDVESLRVSHCNDLAKIHAALQATSAEVGA